MSGTAGAGTSKDSVVLAQPSQPSSVRNWVPHFGQVCFAICASILGLPWPFLHIHEASIPSQMRRSSSASSWLNLTRLAREHLSATDHLARARHARSPHALEL